MATCKECLHYRVCAGSGLILDPLHGGVICEDYKHKEDVVEVVHGRWVEIQKYDIFECSECGYEWYVHGIARVHPLDNSAHYCPDCGADMRGDKNG